MEDEGPTTELAPTGGQVKTMSSMDIAEITGKSHKNVMRDIRLILGRAGIGELKFELTYLDAQNKERPCYQLPVGSAIW